MLEQANGNNCCRDHGSIRFNFYKSIKHDNISTCARVGKLSKEFQSKLGWMVGNLFSRVGVRDWKEETENEEERIINDILCFSRKKPLWINHKMYKKILKKHPDFDTFSVNRVS